MSCPSAKPVHATEEGARRAAITASKRAGLQLSYYKCPECQKYHLTRSVGGDNPDLASLRRRK